MKTYPFLILLYLFIPAMLIRPAIAQGLTGSDFPIQLQAKQLSVTHGLTQSTVTSAVQDKEGYIWIGTVNGLNRFDGETLTPFWADGRSGLPSHFIRRLHTDDTGTLWVGTDKGLVKYLPHLEQFIPLQLNQNIDNGSIAAIHSNATELHIATQHHSYRINRHGHTITQQFKLNDAEIRQAIIINDIHFLLDYSGTLHRLSSAEHSQFPLVHAITPIANGVLAATQQGLQVILTNRSPASLTNTHYTHIAYEDAEHLLAIAGTHLYRLSLLNKATSDSPSSPQIAQITTLGEISLNGQKIDGQKISGVFPLAQSLLLGSFNLGLLNIAHHAHLLPQLNLPVTNVWDMAVTADNQLFVATDDAQLFSFDHQLKHYRQLGETTPGAKQIRWTPEGIYIATQTGLFITTPSGTQTKLIMPGNFWSLALTDDFLFFGDNKGNVRRYHRQSQQITQFQAGQDNEPILALHHDLYQRLWVATQSGLFVIAHGHIEQVTEQMTISLASNHRSLYIGTDQGLQVLDLAAKETRVLLTINKPIYSITRQEHHLVLTTDQAVLRYNTQSQSLQTFNATHGSQQEYHQQASILFDDVLLLGGQSGLTLVDNQRIDALLTHISPPEVTLNQLLIFNEPRPVGSNGLQFALNHQERLTLQYSDYPVTMTFSTPNHADASIRYRLKGLSDKFIKASHINRATYTNLSPGIYQFEVYAKDNLTQKHGMIKQLEIEVTPPWWLAAPAKALYFFSSMLLVCLTANIMHKKRLAQRQIAQSEERLKLSLWGSGDEMWDWDIISGKIFRSNIWGTLDFPQDGQRAGDWENNSNIHPADQGRVREALAAHFSGKTSHFEASYRVRAKDGHWLWILDRAKIVEQDESGTPLRMTGTIKDISSFKQVEEQLQLFQRAIQNVSDGMFILDNHFHFLEVNPACCHITGRQRQDYLHTKLGFESYPDAYTLQIQTLLKKQGYWHGEIDARRGDGSPFQMALTIDAIYDNQSQPQCYVGVFSDITRRKRQEEELRQLTNNDALTGLPNRSSLQVTLNNLVSRDSHHTLMVLDLDKFKKINDSLGHQIGDTLLIEVAKRLKRTLPAKSTLYRLGGDEFAILIDKQTVTETDTAIAGDIINQFASPFTVNRHQLVIGPSIGIVVYPEDDQNEQALLRKADIAMYHAKSAGGNRYQFYSESFNQQAIRQLEVENLIREALRKDYFQVYYQPKFSLVDGQLAGMEALVRLVHPQKGVIQPNEFIPLAEENGLIIEIGEIVLKKACFATQNWRRAGLFQGRVAVNLSSEQFALSDLQTRISGILHLTQLPAESLELEITEGTVITQPEQAIKIMQRLSKMGIHLALDDFGTGYSSLSYLKRFPIHCLKIDKVFIDDIAHSQRDLKMADSIITIAHNMRLSVVAEGVEHQQQATRLQELGCEQAQGYLFSESLNEADFHQLLLQYQDINEALSASSAITNPSGKINHTPIINKHLSQIEQSKPVEKLVPKMSVLQPTQLAQPPHQATPIQEPSQSIAATTPKDVLSPPISANKLEVQAAKTIAIHAQRRYLAAEAHSQPVNITAETVETSK